MRKKSNITKEDVIWFSIALISIATSIYVGFRLAGYKDGYLLELGEAEGQGFPVAIGAIAAGWATGFTLGLIYICVFGEGWDALWAKTRKMWTKAQKEPERDRIDIDE